MDPKTSALRDVSQEFQNPGSPLGIHFCLLWDISFFPAKFLWASGTISQLHLKYVFILVAPLKAVICQCLLV